MAINFTIKRVPRISWTEQYPTGTVVVETKGNPEYPDIGLQAGISLPLVGTTDNSLWVVPFDMLPLIEAGVKCLNKDKKTDTSVESFPPKRIINEDVTLDGLKGIIRSCMIALNID